MLLRKLKAANKIVSESFFHQFLDLVHNLLNVFIVGTPSPLYKGGFEFSKFSQKGGIQIFLIKMDGSAN